MFIRYYFLDFHDKLQSYLDVYFPLVKKVAETFDIDLADSNFSGDHLGVQALSAEEFDMIDKLLASYCTILRKGTIHNRRNNIYRLNKPLFFNDQEILLLEVFEPKPGAEIDKLKPGIEHISFKVDRYDEVLAQFKKAGHPIDKEVEMDGSKFFKTKFMNLVEIEFRNDSLADLIS